MSSCWAVHVSDLASSVRHDLRDPLGAIAHWVQLLETPELDRAMRARALQGIRTAVSEQLTQVEQLSDLLEQLGPSSPDGQSHASPWSPGANVDLLNVLDQVGESVSTALRKRLLRMDRLPAAGADSPALVIQADEPALVQALATLATLGLKQLLNHEQLLLGLQPQAPLGACRIALQVRVDEAGEPINQPWRMLRDAGEVRGLALIYARSVLSLHRADLHIVTTLCADDTLLLDFPLTEAALAGS